MNIPALPGVPILCDRGNKDTTVQVSVIPYAWPTSALGITFTTCSWSSADTGAAPTPRKRTWEMSYFFVAGCLARRTAIGGTTLKHASTSSGNRTQVKFPHMRCVTLYKTMLSRNRTKSNLGAMTTVTYISRWATSETLIIRLNSRHSTVGSGAVQGPKNERRCTT